METKNVQSVLEKKLEDSSTDCARQGEHFKKEVVTHSVAYYQEIKDLKTWRHAIDVFIRQW